ncbi:restriction endonuclease subunit S [Aeromonas veronii]|uniref:restriction endonuclease subunit S n=1 Tax=Aeromonas veronii TaxID=654 RepID=UPI001D09D5D8|nr:restriction endonuclease subunit S [Aeromonas veronii]UDN24559.1 restriction endonuclease subunit S [Aeromonas veronii]
MAGQMIQDKASEMAAKQTIPTGYKQTEVGVIPEDWRVSTVGNEYEIKLGKMLDSVKNRGVPKLFLGNRAVQWGHIDISDLSTVPMSRSDIEMFRLCDGDLLVCEGGEVGRAAIWNSPISECYYQKALHRLRPLHSFNSQLMASLLRYWADSGFLRNYVTQTSIAHLPREKFMEVPMPIPPVYEQTAIAYTLCDTDALLTGLEQLMAKKQAIKTAAMQQLLTGRTRLPQFAQRPDGTSKGYKSSELGDIPEDWEVVPFGNTLTIRHGKNQKAVENPNGTTPIFATGGQIGWADQYLWNKPSVLIGRKGTIDKPRYSDTPFWTVDTLFYSEIKDCADPKFIFYKFCMIDWMQYNEASGVPSLNAGTIERVLASLPLKEEQTAIATILSDMDSELNALEQKLAKARDVKQGMMQQLLTGRIRLPLPQEA